MADVNELFLTRAKEAIHTREAQGQAYWTTDKGNLAAVVRPVTLSDFEELDRERTSLIQELLGHDVKADKLSPPPWAYLVSSQDGDLAFLPEEKRNAVQRIRAEFEQKMRERIRPGILTPEKVREIEEMERDREQELARCLTPAELRDYELRFSPTAQVLRQELEAFKPTEDEFKSIFELRKEFDAKYGALRTLMGPLGQDRTTEEVLERGSDERILRERLSDSLGPDRYREYRRSVDPDYRMLRASISEIGLTEEQLNAVYETKQAAERRMLETALNSSLTDGQRVNSLSGIRIETERCLSDLLGPETFSKLARIPASNWLKRLETGMPAGAASTAVTAEVWK